MFGREKISNVLRYFLYLFFAILEENIYQARKCVHLFVVRLPFFSFCMYLYSVQLAVVTCRSWFPFLFLRLSELGQALQREPLAPSSSFFILHVYMCRLPKKRSVSQQQKNSKSERVVVHVLKIRMYQK